MMTEHENDSLGVFGQPEGDSPFEGVEGGPLLPEQDEGAEAPPRKKRVSRKKTDKAAEQPEPAGQAQEQEPSEENAGESPPEADDDLNVAGEGREAPDRDILVMGLADGPADNQEDMEGKTADDAVPEGADGESVSPAAEPETETGVSAVPGRLRAMTRPRDNRPVSGHAPLTSLNLNELDRGLSREERQEWNDIYASFRSKSVLTGRIIGVDPNSFYVRNKETGALERRRLYCAVVISYRVKVLIPETEFWMPGEERPSHVFRNMTGAEIDYVILDVDREGGVAIASRRMGMAFRRHFFGAERGGHSVGERQTCRVMSVGPTLCLLECGGYDITLGRRDMSHSSIYDLREKYRRGETLDCIITAYDRAAEKLEISVREAEPHPFDGITNRHPLGCRRQAVISGKYGGGVFCTLPDGTTCLCLYTAQHTDREFLIGDTVLLVIVQFDHQRSLVYGRILSKM